MTGRSLVRRMWASIENPSSESSITSRIIRSGGLVVSCESLLCGRRIAHLIALGLEQPGKHSPDLWIVIYN
jgi:hypothetical protein